MKDLWKLNTTVTVTANNGNNRTVVVDKWEGLLTNYESSNTCRSEQTEQGR